MKFVFIVFAIFFVWAGTVSGAMYFFSDWTTRGQFGDSFGSVNALFSGLAFAGLIYTIYLQRKELEMQRNELQLQREEMQKSRAELAEQAKVQKLQFMATIARLKADAHAANVEAYKLDAEPKKVGAMEFRQATSKNVRTEASQILDLAMELEQLAEEN